MDIQKKMLLEISKKLQEGLISLDMALEDANEYVGEIIIVSNHLGFWAVDFCGFTATRFPLDDRPEKTKYSGEISAGRFKSNPKDALIYALKNYK